LTTGSPPLPPFTVAEHRRQVRLPQREIVRLESLAEITCNGAGPGECSSRCGQALRGAVEAVPSGEDDRRLPSGLRCAGRTRRRSQRLRPPPGTGPGTPEGRVRGRRRAGTGDPRAGRRLRLGR